MSKNDVNFRLSGDSGDAQRAWLEIIGVMKQFQTEIARMGNKLETQTKAIAGGMDKSFSALQRLQKGFQNVMGIIGSVRQAFTLLNQEISAHEQLGKNILDPRLRYEYALRGMAQNMNTQEFKKVKAAIEEYNGPMDRAQIAENVKYAVSSVGLGFEKQEVARGAVEVSERFQELAATGEATNLLTTGMLRLYSASPSLQRTDAQGRPDYSTATAFFKGALEKSAQASPEDFAKYTAVAASQLISTFGMKPEQAMSFLAATQTETGDITGRMGARVALNFADTLNTIGEKYGVGGGNVFQVREWLRKGETEDARTALRELVGAAGVKGKIVGDLKKELGGLKGMTDAEIEGSLSTAAKYRVPLKQWVTGEGRVGETSATALAALNIEDLKRAEEERQRMFREDATFEMSRADIARRSAVGERQETVDKLSRRGSYLKTLETLQELEGMPEGGWGRTFDKWLTPLGVGQFRNKLTQNQLLQARAKFTLQSQYLGVEGIPMKYGAAPQGDMPDISEYKELLPQLPPERAAKARQLFTILDQLQGQAVLDVRIVNDVPVAEAPNPTASLGE